MVLHLSDSDDISDLIRKQWLPGALLRLEILLAGDD